MGTLEFPIYLHVGGKFVRDPKLRYHGGLFHTIWIKPGNVKSSQIREKLEGFNIDLQSVTDFVWYKNPGKRLENGLVLIVGDDSIEEMLILVTSHGYIDLYVEHKMDIQKQRIDGGPLNSDKALTNDGPTVDHVESIANSALLVASLVNFSRSEVNSVLGQADFALGDGHLMQENIQVNAIDNNDSVNQREEDGLSGDEYINVPWLTDNEDEEWQEARKNNILDKTVHGRQEETLGLVEINEVFIEDRCSESINSDDEVSFATTSDDDSEAEEARRRRSQHKVFDSNSVIPEFEVGMIFMSQKQFKDAVLAHSIYVRRELILIKNDKRRIRVLCVDKRCNWVLLLSMDGRTRSWMIKTYKDEHTCPHAWNNNRVRSKTIGRHLIKTRGISALTLSHPNIQQAIFEELHLEITVSQARRAKQLVVKEFQGNIHEEYSKLFDYRKEILKKNPTSTIDIKVERPTANSNLVFLRFYVCFGALRDGFLEGCRPFIGLDGAFLKGPCKGQLLAAVAKDANNQMYPVAWAIVESENTNSWTWFLENLGADLKIGDGTNFTFMSDQQKGLIAAIQELFPKASYRRCARHIYANFRKKHKGKQLQRLFWILAKSTNEAEFKKNLEEIKKLNPAAAETILQINPKYWCKAFFDTFSKCDAVDNNMSETFNGFILDARYKGVLSLLEDLRLKSMKRNIEKEDFAENKFVGDFGPKIWEKIEENRDAMSQCQLKARARYHYEVKDRNGTFVVNMKDHKCACRGWDVSGIPCKHAMLIIHINGEAFEDYVHPCYRKQAYINTYKHCIIPLDGMQLWEDAGMPSVDPPIPRKQAGRPKKKRHLEEWEVSDGTSLSRKGRAMTCQFCFKKGHNSRSCLAKKQQQNDERTSTTVIPQTIAQVDASQQATQGIASGSGEKTAVQATQTKSLLAKKDSFSHQIPKQYRRITKKSRKKLPTSDQPQAPTSVDQPTALVCVDLPPAPSEPSAPLSEPPPPLSELPAPISEPPAPISVSVDPNVEVNTTTSARKGVSKGKGKETKTKPKSATEKKKKGKFVGFGTYVNPTTGLSIYDPGLKSKRILSLPTKKTQYKKATQPSNELQQLLPRDYVSVQSAMRATPVQVGNSDNTSAKQKQCAQSKPVTFQQLDAERCARKRALEAAKLDQLEEADWGTLLQAMSD